MSNKCFASNHFGYIFMIQQQPVGVKEGTVVTQYNGTFLLIAVSLLPLEFFGMTG